MLIRFILNLLFPQTENQQHITRLLAHESLLVSELRIFHTPFLTFSLFQYRNPIIRDLIWHLKYYGDDRIATFFAETIHSTIRLSNTSSKTLIIPIPITRKKARLRGYNQSGLIAKALAKLKPEQYDFNNNVLYKIKDTLSQARLKDKQKRLKNVKDSFAIKDKAALAGRSVILIDDVWTTGGTLTEASKVVLEAGAKNIVWITIAH